MNRTLILLCGLAALPFSLGCSSPPPTPTLTPLLAPPKNGIQLSMGPFEVPTGNEVQLCRTMKLDNDKPVALHGLDHRHTIGSHHFILFRLRDNSKSAEVPDQVFPCWGIVNFDQWDFVADMQQNEAFSWTMPEGAAIILEPHQQVMIQAHYVNATTVKTPTVGMGVLNLNMMPMEQVTRKVGSLFTVNTHIDIPPHSELTIQRNCIFSQPARIIGLTGHFHARGRRFSVDELGADEEPTGQIIYQNTDWNDGAFVTYDPTKMNIAFGVHFTCSYQNTTDQHITWGGHADVQEHCNLFMHYIPEGAASTEPTLTCTNGSGGW